MVAYISRFPAKPFFMRVATLTEVELDQVSLMEAAPLPYGFLTRECWQPAAACRSRDLRAEDAPLCRVQQDQEPQQPVSKFTG